jgi:cell division protein FtsB
MAENAVNMLDIAQVIQLQTDTVAHWHEEPVENQLTGILGTVCEQHRFNFLLWHQEDIARSPDVTDTEIAKVKRSIDKLNQQRNDWIEKVDDEITRLIEGSGVQVADDAPMNTETPGCTIDRLSILALRIYHLREQLEREGVSQEHLDSVIQKIAICQLQKDDLNQSLGELLNDIFAGRKRHRTYRQFKMYNDPTLNPYLYDRQKLQSAGNSAS